MVETEGGDVMLFWLYMLVFVLMCPGIMVLFGRMFLRKPPDRINALVGYRTTMSMMNMDTWTLAHQVCGRFWYRWGMVLLPVSVVAMLFVLGKSTETVGTTGMVIVGVQMIPMVGVIVPTERALRRTFDRNGLRKLSTDEEGQTEGGCK